MAVLSCQHQGGVAVLYSGNAHRIEQGGAWGGESGRGSGRQLWEDESAVHARTHVSFVFSSTTTSPTPRSCTHLIFPLDDVNGLLIQQRLQPRLIS